MNTTEQTIPVVQQAYAAVAPEPGAWVGLVDLYNAIAEIADIARVDTEAALKELSRRRVAVLNPEANQRALSQTDRDWALWYGGEWQHMVAIAR